jgi:hypothetical protein
VSDLPAVVDESTPDGFIRLEFMDMSGISPKICLGLLPANCYRILVDSLSGSRRVYGFIKTADNNRDQQIEVTLSEPSDVVLISGETSESI